MPTTPRKHTTLPRAYIKESLVLDKSATIKIGDPYNAVSGIDYGWKDMIGAITVKGVGANDPTWAAITGLGNMFAYSFSATAMKEVWVNFHIDHDYAMGTPIYLHTHWLNAAAVPNTGKVRWGFEYTIAKGHQQAAFPAPTTVYVNQSCNATRYMHHIAETSLTDAVPGTNIEPDCILMVRIFRDAADPIDDCSDAVFLLTADCHYQVGQYATKNKAPNFFT